MKGENWKIGNYKSVVVSNEKVRNTNFPCPPNAEESIDEDVEHYGGYLVCESIGNRDHAKLIAAAPDMLEALIELISFASEWINDNHPAMKKARSVIKKATEQ